jgi:hypothetical protein
MPPLLSRRSVFTCSAAGAKQPLISAARYGSGRVIHFGHEAMLGAPLSPSTSGLARLLLNAASWASGTSFPIRVAGSTSWAANIAASLAAVSVPAGEFGGAACRARPACRHSSTLRLQASPVFVNAGVVAPGSLASSRPHVYITNGQVRRLAVHTPRQCGAPC